MNHIVIFITAPSTDEAETIGRTLVEEKLAACANIVPGVNSIYRWKGKIESSKEALMIVKSRSSLLDRIIARVKELHSYSVPEIIAMPIAGGSSDYLNWIEESTI